MRPRLAATKFAVVAGSTECDGRSRLVQAESEQRPLRRGAQPDVFARQVCGSPPPAGAPCPSRQQMQFATHAISAFKSDTKL